MFGRFVDIKFLHPGLFVQSITKLIRISKNFVFSFSFFLTLKTLTYFLFLVNDNGFTLLQEDNTISTANIEQRAIYPDAGTYVC